jgi:hypothetical protein
VTTRHPTGVCAPQAAWHRSCAPGAGPADATNVNNDGQMSRMATYRRPRCFQWRAYGRRAGRRIEAQLRARDVPTCPICEEPLEARPASRLGRCIVLDAGGYDLDCRGCRRFWCVVCHTARSLRLLRMRRFVAAVKAAAFPTGFRTRDRGSAAIAG